MRNIKNCPKGMGLNCTIWDNVEFDHIDMKSNYPIYIKKSSGEMGCLTENGCLNFDLGAKCVIFPKGKTTWEGFIPPYNFKDGDIIYNKVQQRICIYYHGKDEPCFPSVHYCRYNEFSSTFELLDNKLPIAKQNYCLASEEKKQKLFQAIKDNGYKWNAETKTLEKLITPNFKVGDIIQDKTSYKVKITAVNTEDRFYIYESLIAKGIRTITFIDQDDWELVEYLVGDHFIDPKNNNVFVITKIENNGNYNIESLGGLCYIFEMRKTDIDEYTKIHHWAPEWLKPFDKVLIRDGQDDSWVAVSFSHIDDTKEFPYVTSYAKSRYCIPYNSETEHLVGTTSEEPEFYKL